MQYRKISANHIFNGYSFIENDSVLIIDQESVVRDIVTPEEAGDNVENFQGILSPGLINAHCHLELSHMKNVVPPHTGLVNFLIAVVTKRSQQSEETILESIHKAEKEMYENGIDGVADVCNTAHAISTKKRSKMQWHNLIEVINFFDSNLQERMAHNNTIVQWHQSLKGTSVLTPHAPYTVSSATFKAINEATAHQIISIHNQETAAEDELFEKGSGDFLRLYAAVGMPQSPFPVSRCSSLQTYLPYFTNAQTVLLVHNTFIKEDDILFAQQQAQAHHLKIVFCLCPNADQYIENRLPPVDLLIKHNCDIVIGTDSYSSNWQLNIAAELKTILNGFPNLTLETVLRWATSNGAKALCWNNLGSFEKGKKPGVVLLEGDAVSGKLTGVTKRII